jgi:N,N'-diacetyllegionaminate synthase
MKNLTFIAEIGMNYNTNLGVAYELIRQAKLADADIVKFQLGWRDKPGEINHLTHDDISSLYKWANFFEIDLMFSIISHDAFELIKNFPLKHIKIASRTTKDDISLVNKIINLNIQTYISFGMSEVENFNLKKTDKLSYLHCVSKYPTFYDEIKKMPKDFSISIYDGYSDHTIGVESALIAISRGARIIEKHFTLDKSDTTIRDHALSATPDEFRQMVDTGRQINRILNFCN